MFTYIQKKSLSFDKLVCLGGRLNLDMFRKFSEIIGIYRILDEHLWGLKGVCI